LLVVEEVLVNFQVEEVVLVDIEIHILLKHQVVVEVLKHL
jgi:hypothetical protein